MVFKKIINKIFKSNETKENTKIYTGKYSNFIKEQNKKDDLGIIEDNYKINHNIQNNMKINYNKDLSLKDALEDRYVDTIQQKVIDNAAEDYNLDKLEKEYEKKYSEKGLRDTLKYTIVLYLNQIFEHPLKINLWTTNHLDEICTKEQIEEYVLKKGYIKEAEGNENLKNIIPTYTVVELKEILKKYNLKVSGRKQELINRLKENLSQEELCKEFTKKSYIVTEKGLKLIKENPQVTVYHKYFLHHDIRGYEAYYQENKTENLEKFSINYLILEGEKNIEKCKWSLYYWQSLREIAYLYFDYKEFELALNYFMQLVICELSFWDDNYFSIEYGVHLSEQYIERLLKTVEIVKLDFNELKNQFYDCYNNSKVPLLIIPKEDMFKYFLEIINGTNILYIAKEINDRISFPDNLKYEMHFNNITEINELVEKIRQYNIIINLMCN